MKSIAEFHSTLLMNTITFATAISFYPNLTLRRLGLINYGLPSDGLVAFGKYRRRGFKLEGCLDLFDELEDHRCIVDPSCPSATRSIHDQGVLSIPLDCIDETTQLGHAALIWRLANASCCHGEPDGFTLGPKGDFCACSFPTIYLLLTRNSSAPLTVHRFIQVTDGNM